MTKEYRLEEELLGPTPRRIARTGQSIYLSIALFVYMAIGVGLLLNPVGEALVKSIGKTLPAVITQKRVESDGGAYSVRFRYRYGGSVYSGESDVSEADYAAAEPGSPVIVRTLPWAPGFVPALPGFHGDEMVSRFLIWLYFGLWAVCAPMIVIATFFKPRHARALITMGCPIAARVTEKKTVPCGDDAKMYYIYYEFTPKSASHPFINAHCIVSQEQWKSVAVGDTLTVLYDAKRTKRSLLYRFAGYRAGGS